MDDLIFYHYRKKIRNKMEFDNLCQDPREDRCICKKCYTFEFTEVEYNSLKQQYNQLEKEIEK